MTGVFFVSLAGIERIGGPPRRVGPETLALGYWRVAQIVLDAHHGAGLLFADANTAVRALRSMERHSPLPAIRTGAGRVLEIVGVGR